MSHQSHQLVKRFVAPTMSRALELVQRELGPEAVILSSKRVDKGVEIVTSLEPDLPTRGIDVRREFGRKFDAELDTAFGSDSAWRSTAGIEQAVANYGGTLQKNGPASGKSPKQLAEEIEKARERMFEAKRRAKENAENNEDFKPASNAAPRTTTYRDNSGGGSYSSPQHSARAQVTARPEQEDSQLSSLQSELADMRMLLEQQIWRMGENRSQISELTGQLGQQIQMPNKLNLVAEHLQRLGLSESVQQELLAGVGHLPRASEAWRACMGQLAKRLPIDDKGILEASGVYAFFGQTGVGKTTTIAKLAAQYVLRHGPGHVALVTTDTYRVGAYDQLRTMGKILNVPVRVVDAENSLLTVLSSLRQFPLILIDTAGFRYGDPMLKAQLAQFDRCPMVKRVLVLSCNSQLATMKASIHAHSSGAQTKEAQLQSCVLTKLDESASLGEALSVVVEKQLPVSYITDGQEIPKDIAPASGASLVAKAVAAIKQNAGQESTADDHATSF